MYISFGVEGGQYLEPRDDCGNAFDELNTFIALGFLVPHGVERGRTLFSDLSSTDHLGVHDSKYILHL